MASAEGCRDEPTSAGCAPNVVSPVTGADAEANKAPAPKPWLKRVVVVVLIAIAVVIVVRAARGVDWSAVGRALRRLSVGEGVALLAVLALRQVLNSVPLALFTEKLGLRRALLSDTTANLVAYITPPPGDMVMRVSMFRSWRVDVNRGMTGVTLNMVSFYAIRFLAPTVGLVLLSVHEFSARNLWVAIGSGLVSVTLLGGLALILRSDRTAAWIGTTAGSALGRFRSSIRPEAWAASLVESRLNMLEGVRRGLGGAMLALLGMVSCDAAILTLALRFVGLSSERLTILEIAGTFFIAYPLTLFPVGGLGILDATLLALLTEIAGVAGEADIAAALILWRVTTILVPLAVGVPALLAWRRSARRTATEAA
jgi:uncharacterized membrane protein YbhN (UPF0104 family)